MIEQIAIAATGVTAIWLSQSKSADARRYACLFGLAGQPFWFWSAISAEQWGIFVLCCFYTVAWARGVRTNWFPKRVDIQYTKCKPGKCSNCGGVGGKPVYCKHCRIPDADAQSQGVGRG